MFPAYFDGQRGGFGSILIEGTAQISYSTSHLENRRYIGEVEESVFGLEVPLVCNVIDLEEAHINVEARNFGNIVG